MYQFRRDMPWTDDDNPGFGGSYTDEAGRIMQGNTFDYPYIHGKALLKAGYSFCSASAKAFETDSTNLRNFWAADIICGKQVTTPAGRGSMPEISSFQEQISEPICGTKSILQLQTAHTKLMHKHLPRTFSATNG